MDAIAAAGTLSLIESLGPTRDPELENKRKLLVAMIAQIGDQEWAVSNLLDKMAKDRQKASDLKEILGLTQRLARNVKDPTKDDKSFHYIITLDDQEPFDGMEKVYGPGVLGGGADQTAALQEAGITAIDYSDELAKKMIVWKVEEDASLLSGKQKSSFYNQKESSLSSAISELNSISSQDNVLLQNYRSKIDTALQLLSTLLDAYTKANQGVIRRISA